MARPPSPATSAPAGVQRLRLLARVLDDSLGIPGTRWRIGLDPLIGLIPGFGDGAGALVSLYVIVESARLGVSRATLLRMAGNVALEAIVGAIPLIGDLFDAGWKANVRNLRLLEAHLADPRGVRRASRGWLVTVAGGLALVLLGAGALAVWLALSLLQALGALF